MKVSIVTVCRNAGVTITDCVSSVLVQKGVDVEYIVIDGQSTDDTLQRIEPFAASIAQLVSERDAGIYDAMNKGLCRANGDIVGFLNADDCFASSDIVAAIAEAFRERRADVVFGDVEIHTKAGRLARVYRGSRFRLDRLGAAEFPPHPSFYARTELLRRAGGFDTRFRIAADFDLMMRVFQRPGVTWSYLPRTFVKMRAGGISNQGLSSYLTISRELVLACEKNRIAPKRTAIYGRALRKGFEAAAALQRAFWTRQSFC